MNKRLLFVIIFSFIFGEKTERIISIGGCVTETVFALNQGEKVVAVDISSTIPNKVKKLPQVGYIRAISSEGILSMSPDYILTTTDIGPPKVVEQLRKSGVKMEIFKSPHSVGEIIDLFGGQEDINRRQLRCVGNTHDRLQEDGLRLLRAARFIITKTVNPDEELQHALETSIWWQWLEETVSTERIREELHKMFKHDTQATMKFLVWNCNPAACRRLFSGDLWLKPHLGKK